MSTTFGTFGAPPDVIAWTSLLAALGALLAARSPRLVATVVQRPRACLALLALTASLLSAGYIVHYLRGGPRIIDATSYFLEARTLASGHFAFSVPAPSGSFRGRFLLPAASAEKLGVIFPPGYPLILAAGFLLHAPMAVGPALAALIVLVTYLLAKRLFDDKIGLMAAALSVVSATLRYHTADTMSHGWAALLGTTSLVAVLAGGPLSSLVAGMSCGWLVATRPVTGIVYAVATALLCRSRVRAATWGLGLLPGVFVLLAYDHAVTAHWFTAPQPAYYALADGPIDCFRYGFGRSIGCVGEHGDFVRHNLPQGYGFAAAAGTTLRRLKMHLLDAGNCEPFALALIAAAFVGCRRSSVRLLAFVVLGVIVAYVPFYFDGNYPGGGARFYADALPLEHVLLAWFASRVRLERFVLPLALTGFATHAVFEHRQLRNREGGRPMFEADVLERSGVHRGIVFVDTDHGFNLGHKPGVGPDDGVLVARLHRDGHDWTLFESLGRPAAYVYRFSLSGEAAPRLSPYVPEPSTRFEAESEWPPLGIVGGWVRRDYAPCASRGAGMGVNRTRPDSTVTLEVVVPRDGPYVVSVGWLGHAPEGVFLHVGSRTARAPLSPRSGTSGCGLTVSTPMTLRGGPSLARLHVPPRAPAVDFLQLDRATGS